MICKRLQEDLLLHDIAVYTSYTLFVKATGKRIDNTDWKVNVTEAIIEEVTLPLYHGRRKLPVAAAEWAPFPHQILPNKVKKNPSRLCLVCKAHGKNSENRWECEKCEVALLMHVCFKAFHTQIVLNELMQWSIANRIKQDLFFCDVFRGLYCDLYTPPDGAWWQENFVVAY